MSFEEQIMEYKDELFRRAMKLCKGNEADSKDLVHDTAIKAIDNEDKFEKGTNLRAWLHTILYNTFVSKHRKKKRHYKTVEKHKNKTIDVMAHANYDKTHVEEDPLAGMEVAAILDVLKDNLGDVFYETLEQVVLHDRSYKEAAEVLDVPLGTIMSRLYRARQKAVSILLEKYDVELICDYLGMSKKKLLEEHASS